METHCEEHNDPGGGAVVLAVGVDEAHGVEQGGEHRFQLRKLCVLYLLYFNRF